MSKTPQFMSLSVLVVIGLLVVGCSQRQAGQEPAAPLDQASQAQPMATEHGDHQHGEAGHAEHAGHDQYEDALAELSLRYVELGKGG